MKYSYLQLVLIVVVAFSLSACRSDSDKVEVAPLHKKNELSAVELKPSAALLKKFAAGTEQTIMAQPAERREKESNKQRQVKVTGAVLFNKQSGQGEDAVKKVDGGEVKVTVPFD